MERLQRWFGGGKSGVTTQVKHDEEQSVEQKPSKPVENIPIVHGMPLFPEFMIKQKAPQAASAPAKPAEPSQPAPKPTLLVDVPKDAKVTETGFGQLMNQGREMMLKVVPLEEGDCLSCKLIGSGVIWGAAGAVLYNYSKAKGRYTGSKRKIFTIQALSLTTALALLGAARFFDLSIFSPPDEKGHKKGFSELLQEDLNNLQKLTSIFSSSTKESENKSDN